MEKVDDSKGAIESAVRSEESAIEFAPVKRTTKRRWIWNASHWQAAEIAFFVILIIVVWGLFALPTVFYMLLTSEKNVRMQLPSHAYVNIYETPSHPLASTFLCGIMQ